MVNISRYEAGPDPPAPPRRCWYIHLARWFDSWAGIDEPREELPQKIEWLRSLPFIGMHVACLGVIWVGWSPVAFWVAVALFVFRMFVITGFYHRYFSHRSFKISRAGQFIFAFFGICCMQRGPLWWAGHHRRHHQVADREEDIHSPVRHGFLWSHMGWIMSRANFAPPLRHVRDFVRFPELCFLDRFDIIGALVPALGLFILGGVLESRAPGLGTSSWQMLIWGFFISTVALYHATFTINSVDHMWGKRRYETKDCSRNNWLLAILTLGEGWHNNHHHYPVCARQGFFWWELDPTYYLLKLMEICGLIRELRRLPRGVLTRNLVKEAGPS